MQFMFLYFLNFLEKVRSENKIVKFLIGGRYHLTAGSTPFQTTLVDEDDAFTDTP